jgi:hypothetical protein
LTGGRGPWPAVRVFRIQTIPGPGL